MLSTFIRLTKRGITTTTRVARTSLNTFPVATNCLIYGSMSGLAELAQQTLVCKILPAPEDRTPYNLMSVARYMTLGGMVFCPVLLAWYKWLDKVWPGTGKLAVAQKVALDIVLLSPPEYATFYMLMNLMMGESWDTAKKEVAKKLPTTLVFATAFWIPAQIINFKYVSPRMRVVFVAGCTFLEFNMLAFLKNKKVATQGDEKDPVMEIQHQEPQLRKTSSIVHHEPHVALVETVTSTCCKLGPRVCTCAPSLVV
eukprot:TRINITY_DN52663_c0_g1_i1.p1 TRINITY_DN52663_c0_g1~~TRINITY_DN52663_c0_g1_i1.p1  ORF type:complete len:255 (-),score=63.81 TRINITY_DN52663_c0_g1_i1:208-972(-)